MKVFKLPLSPINLQKCLLPDSGFLRKNCGRFCFITLATGEIFLVKIGLFEIKNVKESLFFDGSVYKKACFENKINTNFSQDSLPNISFKNFTVLKKPIVATKINVMVVFCNVLEAMKFDSRTNDLVVVLKNILKMFIVCNKSYLSLSALKNKMNFGIELLIVINSDISDPLQPYEVNSYTTIKIDKCISRTEFEQLHLNKKLPQLGGCNKALALLTEAVEQVSISSKIINLKNKILLIGPKGCGKTLLIHRVAAECKCILIEIPLIDTFITNSKENKMWYILKECHYYLKQGHTCIILIKNIDLICGKKTSNKILMQLISFLDNLKNSSKVMVIATTNSVNDVDMELRKYKRFDEEMEILIPNLKEREDIILQILTECNIKCDLLAIKKLAQRTTGFVGADLKLLVVEALITFYKIQNSFESIDNDVLEKCFKKALTKIIPSGLRSIEGLRQTKKISFSDIGGLEGVKNLLDLSVRRQIEHPEKFQKLGVPLTKGILLYGPPGCAKTTLVKALAQECHIKLLEVSAAELYSPYVGDAEKNIVRLFDIARLSSPAIIFIDEIDAVVGNKCDNKEHGVQDRILSTLLVEMDGIGVKVNLKEEIKRKNLENQVLSDAVIVIGATNRPQVLENALIRPGRFDKLIYIPPPNVLERELILQKLTVKMPLHESVNLKRLAELTDNYSGADLKNLCRECGLNAINLTNMTEKKIHQYNFESIIKDFKPSLNESVVSFCNLFHLPQ